MEWVRRLATAPVLGALAGVLVLGACGSDPEPKFADEPSVSASGSESVSPSVSPSASPTEKVLTPVETVRAWVDVH